MNRYLYLITVVTALIGICLPFLVGLKFYEIETDAIHSSFRKDVDEKALAIEREIGINFETLYALKGIISDSHEITSARFRQTAGDILARHPDIQALEWIPRIPRSKRESFEQSRRQDLPDFEITERQDQGLMIRAADRKDYFPVYYVEPMVGNELALGFDLASNATRFGALELSRDTGKLVATSSITLVQEQANQKGFLTFLPVYKGRPLTIDKRRDNLRGFVLGVFRIGDILNRAIRDSGTAGDRIDLYDETVGHEHDVLHTFASGQGVLAETEFHYRTQLKDIAGRQWAISASPSAGYVAERRSALPQVIVLFGLIFVAFATAFTIFLLRRSATIEHLVLARTEELNDANRKLELLSRTDELTKVANRREFNTRFYDEWLRAVREKSPITMMLIDVDCFKQFNDSYGHMAGDAALKLVASTLKSCIKRPGDFVARYGGEEFVVVLPSTDGPLTFADDIRKNIEALHIPHKNSSVAEVVTISIGVSSITPTQNARPDEFVDCVDKALYKAKESGRNRVEMNFADSAATGIQSPVYALRAKHSGNSP